ncbi:MAG: M3 family metallopeptidase [Acidobacteria bacterium]|nr:M3 family metallopeptidase [Acidobacteriota bacterium]
MPNPLLTVEFRAPFDRIEAAHVEPAVAELLAEARRGIEEIAADPLPRTYQSTMQRLDDLTRRLDYAISLVRHLESVATTPELREAYNATQPLVAEFYGGIPLNEGLWKAIQAYAATPEAATLTGAQARYLSKTIDDFRRHGAELDAAGKRRLAEIDVELSKLTTKFSQNVLDSTNAWELVLTDEARIAGLPASAVAAARESALSKGVEGWRFTLHAPSYIAVMAYLDDRDIRRQMYLAYNTRAASGEHDNSAVMGRILELRQAKAKLLGAPDFADFVIHDRMAHTGARAQQFLDDLRSRTEARFHAENQDLRQFSGLDELEPWDVSYWAEKQRQKLYDFDEEILRPYFPVDRVMAGMYELFGRLLAIRVVPRPEVPGWDPAVQCFDIQDESGQTVGAFYTDWFPRDNKRQGAWMDGLITGVPSSDPSRHHLGLICGNLTPPVGDAPALLTHREVETIFHEFGHLIHHCLSRVEVRTLAGANVAWDFVELPSQIMENWCWEREALDLFARHYQTSEPIPEDLFQKMRRARVFRAANAQMRQLGFGFTDLALHRQYDPTRDGGVIAYAKRALASFSPAKLPENYAMIASFTHLFASPVGYGAGYYSYKWAEVLEADAFTRFRQEGIFNQQVGRQYRDRILAKGDSEDPADLYRSFMGRDPDPQALLERAGLLDELELA